MAENTASTESKPSITPKDIQEAVAHFFMIELGNERLYDRLLDLELAYNDLDEEHVVDQATTDRCFEFLRKKYSVDFGEFKTLFRNEPLRLYQLHGYLGRKLSVPRAAVLVPLSTQYRPFYLPPEELNKKVDFNNHAPVVPEKPAEVNTTPTTESTASGAPATPAPVQTGPFASLGVLPSPGNYNGPKIVVYFPGQGIHP
jgi:hypothetical protein